MVIAARQREFGNLDTIHTVLLRVVAIFLIVFAVQYWMRLTGFHEGAEFRFDTMPPHWRLAASLLAVLLPSASLGLWGGYNWGVVLWAVAILIEIAMHTWFAGLFGTAWLRLLFHFGCAALLAALRVLMWKMANKS